MKLSRLLDTSQESKVHAQKYTGWKCVRQVAQTPAARILPEKRILGLGVSCDGSGVIWNIIPNRTPVIPAKAGIQSVDSVFPKACGVDSRFRRNDCGLERPCLANDTTTRAAAPSRNPRWPSGLHILELPQGNWTPGRSEEGGHS